MADPVVADVTTAAATSAEPVVERKKHRRPRCYRCNKWGHRGAECPKRKQAGQTENTKESANASAQDEVPKFTATGVGIQVPALITLSQSGIDTIVGNINEIVNSAVQVAVQRALELKAHDGTPANVDQGPNTGVAVDEGSVSASVHDLASSINDVNLTGPVDQENTSAESVDAQEMPADATSLEDDNQAVQDDNDDEESEDEEDFHVQV